MNLAIYTENPATMAQDDHSLAEIAQNTSRTKLRETKRWVTAKQRFDSARANGQHVVVLYADAAFDCSKLIYWGFIESMQVDSTGTSYEVRNLRPLRGHRTHGRGENTNASRE